MKFSEVAGLADKELLKKSSELRTRMFEARMKNALGQLANPMEIREMRRDLARLKTAATAKTVKPRRKLTRATRKAAAQKAASKGK